MPISKHVFYFSLLTAFSASAALLTIKYATKSDEDKRKMLVSDLYIPSSCNAIDLSILFSGGKVLHHQPDTDEQKGADASILRQDEESRRRTKPNHGS
jgi:hypothetical protein